MGMFHRPQHNGEPVKYFCGHSLGLQPITTKDYLQQELDKWAKQGVEGHFEEPNSWFHYHKYLQPGLAQLTGAKESEVVAYGSLTANLHFLLSTFYQPSPKRFKILTEGSSFPSDRFAIQTHVASRGLDKPDAVVWLKHDESFNLSTDEIINEIDYHQDSVSVIWLSGVNFMTGQVLDLKAIVEVAHQYNIKVGFDLAHAIGNIPLQLHEWEVDFAVWCSYKYLNAGPGATGGYFVHEKHHPQIDSSSAKPLTILGGWWGHLEETRFQTEQNFTPTPSADAWQHSNANVLSLACLRASLDLFLAKGIENLFEESQKHTQWAIENLNSPKTFNILTPKERGNMLTIQIPMERKKEFGTKLKTHNFLVDWRDPGIMRFSFCPLYNTTEEWKEFIKILQQML